MKEFVLRLIPVSKAIYHEDGHGVIIPEINATQNLYIPFCAPTREIAVQIFKAVRTRAFDCGFTMPQNAQVGNVKLSEIDPNTRKIISEYLYFGYGVDAPANRWADSPELSLVDDSVTLARPRRVKVCGMESDDIETILQDLQEINLAEVVDGDDLQAEYDTLIVIVADEEKYKSEDDQMLLHDYTTNIMSEKRAKELQQRNPDFQIVGIIPESTIDPAMPTVLSLMGTCLLHRGNPNYRAHLVNALMGKCVAWVEDDTDPDCTEEEC